MLHHGHVEKITYRRRPRLFCAGAPRLDSGAAINAASSRGVPLERHAGQLADTLLGFVGPLVEHGEVTVVLDDEVRHADGFGEGYLGSDARTGRLGGRAVS